MTNPNSLLSIMRRKLANAIEPRPGIGESWCINCGLNQGHTMILSADGYIQHVQYHVKENGDDFVSIVAEWPGRTS